LCTLAAFQADYLVDGPLALETYDQVKAFI